MKKAEIKVMIVEEGDVRAEYRRTYERASDTPADGGM